MLKNVGRDVIIVAFAKNLGFLENIAETGIVGDVTEFKVLHEVDETGKIVKDPGEMVFDMVALKKSVILHGERVACD